MAGEVELTVAEVATRLGVGEATVRAWLREGKLQGRRLGGTRLGWRIPEREVERLAESEEEQMAVYTGKVEMFSDGVSLGDATATITELRDPRSGIGSWSGTLRADDGSLWSLFNSGRAELAVPGRGQGNIIVKRLRMSNRGTSPAPFVGSGPSPLGI